MTATPATFEFAEDNGTATGTPAHGTTSTGARTDADFKNIDDSTSAYNAYPIQPGANSFEKWQYGHFSGTYTSISALLFAHTVGSYGTGLAVAGVPPCTNDGTALPYTTPSTTANTNLTTDMTSAISIASGTAVAIGATSPQATGKGTSTTTNPAWTNYLPMQLQTTGSASSGGTGTATYTLQYSET